MTCDNIKCGKNEECAACGQNGCNSYSCFNPDGSKFICLFLCPQLSPTCICKPYYYRPDPKGPCVPLSCSSTSAPPTREYYSFRPFHWNIKFEIFFVPAPTTGSTCDQLKCGKNEECSPCGKNACNTYSCSNPDGTKIACSAVCQENNASCICKPKHYRPNQSGPCIPLSCQTTKSPSKTTASIRTSSGY